LIKGSCHYAKHYVVTIVNIFPIMIRKGAWAFVIFMMAVALSPVAASAVPAGTTMMPMTGGSGGHGSSNGQSTSCNCGVPVQAAAALPQKSPSRATDPCSGTALPVTSGTPGTTGRVLGIRRIYPKNVLDHHERAAVYAAIVARPGTDLAGIARELGIHRETLRYHLDQLESNTRVVVMRDHGIIRYYENNGRYTPLERSVLQHLWNPRALQILALTLAMPGITQAEVAGHLTVTAATVRWYMHRFRDDGIVAEHREGKYTRYTVMPEISRYITPHAVGGHPAATLRDDTGNSGSAFPPSPYTYWP
jgi:DNA-binding MarR family transcriptional regulator